MGKAGDIETGREVKKTKRSKKAGQRGRTKNKERTLDGDDVDGGQ